MRLPEKFRWSHLPLLCFLACLLVYGLLWVGQALGHQPVVNQGTVITWTHPNHAGDAVGAAACVQNRNGVTKCITVTNRIYKYRSRYPQVGTIPNPQPAWDRTGSLIIRDAVTGVEWWWTRAADTRGGPSGICVYEARRPFLSFKPAWACVVPNDTELMNPLDGDAPGRAMLPRPTTLFDPPADFIRGGAGTSPAGPLALAGTAVRLRPPPSARRMVRRLPPGLRAWCKRRHWEPKICRVIR